MEETMRICSRLQFDLAKWGEKTNGSGFYCNWDSELNRIMDTIGKVTSDSKSQYWSYFFGKKKRRRLIRLGFNNKNNVMFASVIGRPVKHPTITYEDIEELVIIVAEFACVLTQAGYLKYVEE